MATSDAAFLDPTVDLDSSLFEGLDDLSIEDEATD